MNSDKAERFFRMLGWLTLAGIVFAAAVPSSAHSPPWAKYALLATGVCCLWEWLSGHERFFLSRMMLGCLLASLLVNCRFEAPFPGFTVSVSAILFSVLCLCFIALVSRRGLKPAVPSAAVFCALLISIPTIVAIWMAEYKYAYPMSLAPAVALQFMLFFSGVAVFSGFLAGGRACAFVLLLVGVRLAVTGIV